MRTSTARRRCRPRLVLLALSFASTFGADSAAAMPPASTAISALSPVLAPLPVTAMPAGAFAVVRGDDGNPHFTIPVAQLERFSRAAQVNLHRRAGSQNAAARQLLSLYAMRAEMERRRISFPEVRIAHALAKIIRERFDGASGYRRFLRASGLVPTDVRLNVIAELGQSAIVRQLQASVPSIGMSEVERATAMSDAVDRFRALFLAGSFARTTCAQEYAAIPACAVPLTD